jgi:hypothetical protein
MHTYAIADSAIIVTFVDRFPSVITLSQLTLRRTECELSWRFYALLLYACIRGDHQSLIQPLQVCVINTISCAATGRLGIQPLGPA